ncbi:molecular chaperone DnaJ [Azospirillum argentinense]|uniref:Molecular chaperone DnaJ n=1 Tax=Azospirillum argentinense TaxID=2970906 RepID=A0A060DJ38_9PROT|nr:TerB family tellurite resistance protein [Azospirillum argentinense]AIB10978.1 molecular chaperone DnaJ [Azospirillum argentinense]EZQ07939.1 molecular chaperone DnaJ [Azospirillum argentinense]KAA1058261.1 DnaJ-like protein DjlA [Azospirillum argentinense]
MSIWGSVLGGAAGFTVGGPIGGLIGLAAGYAVGRGIRGLCGPADATKSIAFTIGVIALSAKMARADGVVKRVEVDTFKRLFRVPPEELDTVGHVFDLARKDTHGFEEYAQQIAGLFDDRRAVLEELLDSLLAIAEADDELHETEVEYLRTVAHIFGFTDEEFERIVAGHHIAGTPNETDPYGVLGVSRRASDEAIKAAHRRLVREHHPDVLIAQGMPQEFVDLATQKVAAINAAFDRIEKERARG